VTDFAMAAAVFPLCVGVIFLLERWFPIHPTQPILSVGLAHDSAWLLLAIPLHSYVVGPYDKTLGDFYRHVQIPGALHWFAQLPLWVRISVFVLAFDFMEWVSHILKHRVDWLWEIHRLHHSQRDLNFATAQRNHLLASVTGQAVEKFPLVVCAIHMPHLIWYGVIKDWHARLYHSNVRTNFGPLRWIFVTPQSHHLHHSIEDRHRFHNYGSILCIWDRIFRTHNLNDFEYPKQGMPDPHYPYDAKRHPWAVVKDIAKQYVWPFAARGEQRCKSAPPVRSEVCDSEPV
jgi:sterol desaturase/sphingolipid hydroxylase (fatty acid hydroxylase superfamily)